MSRKTATKYVNMLKRTVSSEEFSEFAVAVKKYKLENDFSVLVPILEKVIMKNFNLVNDFRVFVKKYHDTQFNDFIKQRRWKSENIPPSLAESIVPDNMSDSDDDISWMFHQ